jgi:hypothetical protein
MVFLGYRCQMGAITGNRSRSDGSAKLIYGHGLELHKLGSSNLKYLNRPHFELRYPDLVAPKYHFSSKIKLTCQFH